VTQFICHSSAPARATSQSILIQILIYINLKLWNRCSSVDRTYKNLYQNIKLIFTASQIWETAIIHERLYFAILFTWTSSDTLCSLFVSDHISQRGRETRCPLPLSLPSPLPPTKESLVQKFYLSHLLTLSVSKTPSSLRLCPPLSSPLPQFHSVPCFCEMHRGSLVEFRSSFSPMASYGKKSLNFDTLMLLAILNINKCDFKMTKIQNHKLIANHRHNLRRLISQVYRAFVIFLVWLADRRPPRIFLWCRYKWLSCFVWFESIDLKK